MPEKTIWTTPQRSHWYIVPDAQELPTGDLVLRSVTGAERSVSAEAVAGYEVTKEEASAFVKEQLTATFDEIRGKVNDFANRLRERTADMREENRKTWDEGVANAPPELRDAAERIRSGLRDLGQALQRVARENLEKQQTGDPRVPPKEDEPA